jgi:putative transposase
MRYDPDRHHRRSIRLKGYDYSQPGAYFVTVCTADRECLFGEIVADEMQLNGAGAIVLAAWNDLPAHYTHVRLDSFVIMPNHIHAVIILTDAPVPVGAGFKPAPGDPATPTDPATPAGPVRAGFKPARTEPTPTVAVPTETTPGARAPTATAPTQPAPGILAPTAAVPPESVGAGFKPAPTVTNATEPVEAGLKPAPTVVRRHALPEIVRAFKTFSARRINELHDTPGVSVWQRNYYEHIIRNRSALARIRTYIETNPERWALDRENPRRTGLDDFESWIYSSPAPKGVRP